MHVDDISNACRRKLQVICRRYLHKLVAETVCRRNIHYPSSQSEGATMKQSNKNTFMIQPPITYHVSYYIYKNKDIDEHIILLENQSISL